MNNSAIKASSYADNIHDDNPAYDSSIKAQIHAEGEEEPNSITPATATKHKTCKHEECNDENNEGSRSNNETNSIINDSTSNFTGGGDMHKTSSPAPGSTEFSTAGPIGLNETGEVCDDNSHADSASFIEEFEDENISVAGPLDIESPLESTNNEGEKQHGESSWGETLAGVAGNVLEWYDFAVFGYFGDVIGEVFFPANQPGHMEIVESFAVFGGAFLMRPIGGMLMGYIGDVYGRKLALIISIFLMAFPTFAMGCLPSYNLVGPLAIVGLVIVRLLQGLSVGGQLMSSLVFTLEKYPKEKWGWYGSFVLMAANLGTLLGGLAGFIIRSVMNDQQIRVWGWRIPFWMGVSVSISGFYLRSHSKNDDENMQKRHGGYVAPADSSHTEAQQEVETQINPIKLAFSRDNRRSLIASAMVPILWSAGFYLSFVWMAVYMADLLEDPIPGSFAINSAALFVGVCIFFPFAGHLSDLYGRKVIMTIGGIGLGLGSPVLVLIIGQSQLTPWLALISQSILGIFLSLWGAPMCAWLVESFDPKIRLTSVAIGYNVAQAIVGGITPSIATLLVDRYGPHSPGYILTALATISLTGLWVVAPKEPPAGQQGGIKRKGRFEIIPGTEEEHHN